MENNLDHNTYLLISKKKLVISVYTSSQKRIYLEELILKKEFSKLPLEEIDYFINENIFKIEKLLKKFVEKISILIDLDIFLIFCISVKKNNFENTVIRENLNFLLNEAKDCTKKTFNKQKIIHMLVDNYKIDNQNFSNLPHNSNGNQFSIDVKFICLENNFIIELEKILKKYQISLNQIFCASYIKKFLDENEKDFFLMAQKLKDGLNPNEVVLTLKSKKKLGFFAKFFDLLS